MKWVEASALASSCGSFRWVLFSCFLVFSFFSRPPASEQSEYPPASWSRFGGQGGKETGRKASRRLRLYPHRSCRLSMRSRRASSSLKNMPESASSSNKGPQEEPYVPNDSNVRVRSLDATTNSASSLHRGQQREPDKQRSFATQLAQTTLGHLQGNIAHTVDGSAHKTQSLSMVCGGYCLLDWEMGVGSTQKSDVFEHSTNVMKGVMNV